MTSPIAQADLNPPRSRRKTIIRIAVGLVVGAVALQVVVSSAGGFSDAFDALGDANPAWLIPALLAEVACYLFISLQIQRLTGPHRRPPLSLTFQVGLVSSGLGSVLPGSPAPGIALAVTQLRRRGVATGRATAALAWMSWFSARSLIAITAISSLIAIIEGDLSPGHTLPVLAAALGAIALLIATAVVISREGTAEWIALLASRLRLRGPRQTSQEARAVGARLHAGAREMLGPFPNRLLLAVTSAAAWIADSCCLYFALRAVGARVGFDVLLLAYCGGLLLSALPLLPGGLGVVEAAVPAILHHFGVPLDTALAGTLAWRGMGLFLPAIVGLLALVRLRLTSVPALEPDLQPAH